MECQSLVFILSMVVKKIQKVQDNLTQGICCKMQNHSALQQLRSIKVIGLGAKSQSKLNFHKQYDESKNIAMQN